MTTETKSSCFWCREKSVFWIFFAAYGLLGLLYVFLGVFWADESWYYSESWLVAGGQVPYRDFFMHHNPLFFYFYSLPQHFFGPSIIVGRLTSLVLMMVLFSLVWRLALKLGGKTAAVIAGGLLITNIFLAYYYSTFSYRALEALLIAAFFSVLFSGLKDILKYPLATMLLSLVVGIRYPIDIVSGMLGLFGIYIIIHSWHQKRVIFISLAAGLAALSAIILPFVILARDQYVFGTITYAFKTTDFWAEFGVMPVPDLANRAYHAFMAFSQTVNTFSAAAAIVLGLLIYLIYKFVHEKPKIKTLITGNREIVFLEVFILLYELFCAAAYLSGVGLRTLSFPAMAVLAGVGISKVMTEVKDKSAVWMLNGLIIALILLTPLAQYGQGGEARPAVRWRLADMHYILDVSARVAADTREGDSVLTLTPPLALEAGRSLMPGMTMELLGFFPNWDTPRVQKYHLFNESMLLDYLGTKQAGAVVLTQGRFYSGMGQGKVLDNYRAEILRVLDANYYLKETVLYPPEIGQGNVFIYLPRPK